MENLPSFLVSSGGVQTMRTLMVLLGILAILLGLQSLLRSRRISRWPATKGNVIRSQLESTIDAQHRLSVAFRYKVKRRYVESRPVSVAVPAAPAAANRTLKRLTNGRKVIIHYDPSNPENVVVNTASAANWLEAVVAGGALILFSLFAF